MSIPEIDPATFTVPANQLLVYRSGDLFYGKKSNEEIVEVDTDDMIRMDLTAADLPCLLPESVYTKAHAEEAMMNLDKSSAFTKTAAYKYSKMVKDQKASKAELTTAIYEIEELIKSTGGDVASERARAMAAESGLQDNITALDNSITFKKLIDRIWIYGNDVYDLNYMVGTGIYFCSTDASVVGTAMTNMPEGTAEGILIVTKNSQVFIEGGTAKGRMYYRYETGAGAEVTQYTEAWVAGAVLSDVTSLDAEIKTIIGTLPEGKTVAEAIADETAAREEEIRNYNKDYTSFEVLPHTTQIPAGSIIGNTILSENITDSTVLNAAVQKTVEPRTLHRIKIRTNQADPSKSDVVIDWGDGTRSSVANQDYEAEHSTIDVAAKEGEYVFSHDYAQALTEANLTSKRFTVKIFGKQYYNISHRMDSAGTLLSNLMCRCFEEDLYLASNMGNISNFCNGSDVLVYASFEAVKYNYFENMQGMFTSCHNLVKAVGFGAITSVATCGSFFSACTALVETDFVIPMNTVRHNSFAQIFNSCTSLAKDISTLFPKVWSMKGVSVSADGMFKWCNHLTGTVPARLLWENQDITWTNTATAFANCSDEIRAQVPVSWGGTNETIDAAIAAGTYTPATKKQLDDLALAASSTSGQDAIVVSGESAAKTVSLALDGTSLSQSTSGLKADLVIAKQDTAETGFAATYFLTDATGTRVYGSKINLIKDQFLKKAPEIFNATEDEAPADWAGDEYIKGHKYLKFTWEITKGSPDTDDDTIVYLDVESLVDAYTSGSAAVVVDNDHNTISLAIDETTVETAAGVDTPVLIQTANGLKAQGIQDAIDYAVSVESSRAALAEEAIASDLSDEVSARETAVSGEASAREEADSALNTALRAEIAKKVDRQITNRDGSEALIFNESDGGGAKFTTSTGFISFVGVNDGTDGLYGQIYALKKNAQDKYEGVRLNVQADKITYKNNGLYADSFDAKYELAVKNDLDLATADLTAAIATAKSEAIAEAESKDAARYITVTADIASAKSDLEAAIVAEAAARAAADNTKVTTSLDTPTGGKALIFNEADGGGAKIERTNGDAYFVGVNDSDGDRSQNHAAASIYALNNAMVGTRFTVFNDMITYKANATKAERNNGDYELAVKLDVTNAQATVQGNLNTHAASDARHTAPIEFVRTAATISELEFKRYICKATLDGTLPAAPADGTEVIVKVVAGGESTVIRAADGDKIDDGSVSGASVVALNYSNQTYDFIYDADAKLWYIL